MILQPQSDLFAFRKRLKELQLSIMDEREIFEDGKFYTAMRVCTESESADDIYDEAAEFLMSQSNCSAEDAERICIRFGPVLILNKDQVLRKYLEHEIKICESILLKLSEDEHTERVRDIINKKNDITTVLNIYH
jgi:tRNA (adenine22-N1)-methyltransferase